MFAALAGLSKFAPLALVPVLATHGLLRSRGRGACRRRSRAAGGDGLAAGDVWLVVRAWPQLNTAAIVSIPALTHDSLHTIYERTIEYQSNRGSPFSVWGLYGGLHGIQTGVQVAAVVLALALAVVPRRPDLIGLAAACAAIVIATQLGVEHWFYLYIPWFFGLVMIALLGTAPPPPGP